MAIWTYARIRKPPTPLSSRNYGSMYPYQKLRGLLFAVCLQQLAQLVLSAYPFVTPPEQAKFELGIFLKPAIGDLSNLDRVLYRFSLARVGAFFDFYRGMTPKEPVTFSAIYLPVWLLGGSVYLRVVNKGNEIPKDDVGGVLLQTISMLFPGSNVPLFSTANYSGWANLTKQGVVPLPFTEQFLQEQEEATNMQVTCLPYTISPFSALKLMNTSPGRTLELAGNKIYIDEAAVSDFTAMPILVPIYVAKYQDEDGDSIIAFLDARSADVNPRTDRRQMLELTRKRDLELPADALRISKNVDYWEPFGRFHRVSGYLGCTDATIGEAVEMFFINNLGSIKNINKLASMESLASDSDQRIREMTKDEWERRSEWLQKKKTMRETFKAKNLSGVPQKQNPPTKNKLGAWAKYSSLPQTPGSASSPINSRNQAQTTTSDRKKSV